MEKMTASEIREYNQSQIYRLAYTAGRISRQTIAEQLSLSMPTISQNLKALEEQNLIEKSGMFQSTGGRKSVAYTCVSNARVAIGTQVSEHRVRIVAVDLFGKVFKREKHDLPYANCPEYYMSFGRLVNSFARSLNISRQRILGVGIAIKGLLSGDYTTVMHSVRMGGAGASIYDFSAHLEYPCQLVHDSEAAAVAEIWYSPQITNALYVSLNDDLGGAIIVQGKIHRGKEFRGGLLEHMLLYPGGEPCYCGNRGCISVYCSAHVLLNGSAPTYEVFFQNLRNGDPEAHQTWQDYLENLSLALGSIHMLLDCDIILGGTLSRFIGEEDIRYLQFTIRQRSVFSPVTDFIRIGHSDEDVFSCGAALPYIQEFLDRL